MLEKGIPREAALDHTGRIELLISGAAEFRQERLEEILCRDSAGREVRIIRFQFVAKEATAGGLRDRPGAQGWKTAAGKPVRLLDRDLYEVVSSGELLERAF